MYAPTPTLALDAGNTRTKAGLFREGRLHEIKEWAGAPLKEIVRWATNRKAKNIILSTVAASIREQLAADLPEGSVLLELDHRLKLPFENTYQTPETLGKDRLAAVAGAFSLFPQQNVLVIDAGTCITFDLLTAEGQYRGGNISPGLRMRYRAMHEYTARLPEVSWEEPADVWGRSTRSALQLGGLLGLLAEIRYYQEEVKRDFGKLSTVLTGGDSQLLAKKLKSKIFVRPNLVLIGLNQILEHNVDGLV